MQGDVAVCGILVRADGVTGEGCVNIDAYRGVILSLSKEPRAERLLFDGRGRGFLVAPGIIDMHVHLRGLELSYKEDEASGTLEAVRAGITLVIDMPNTRPRLDTPAAIELKLGELARRSFTDYGVYAAIPSDTHTARELARMPIIGFKVYPEDLYQRPQAVRLAGRAGKPIVCHCEHEKAPSPIVEGEDVRREYRGCWAETVAIRDLYDVLGLPFHVTHASCPSTIIAAKKLNLTVDTTIHHLLGLKPLDNCGGRVNPPVRDIVGRQRLLQLLFEGYVDAIASDHAPHRYWEKVDPLNCSPGLASMGYWPGLLACLASAGVLTVSELVKLTSYNPARILGLTPSYGTLSSGARANIVVYRLGLPSHTPSKLFSKADNHATMLPAACMEIAAVLVGGEPVYMNGNIVGRPKTVNAASRQRAYAPPSAS